MNCKLPMATLHEVLSKSSPAIAEDAVTQFRSGLVFIINRLHDEVAEGIQLSLLDQTKRLDDEGYDSCKLLIILNHVTEATIGSSATQELLSFIQENVAEPDGLPLLLAHVHSSFPELARAIDELESQAIQEENQLLTVAGGMSKKAEIGLITGGVVVVGVITVCGIVALRKRKSMLAERAIREEQTAHNEERIEAHKAKRLTESIENDPDQIIKDLKNIDKIPNLGKGLENYTPEDFKMHVSLLVGQHLTVYVKEVNNELKIGFMNDVRNTPMYKTELKNAFLLKAEDRENEIFDLLDNESLSHDKYVAKITDNLENEEWFKNAVTDVAVNGMAKARKDLTADLTRSYSQFLSKEVETVKEKAIQDGFDRLENDALKSVESTGLFTTSEIKVKLEISRLATEARDEEARLAEAAEADIRAASLEMDVL